MAKILDRRQEEVVAFLVTEALESEGFTAEEAIPGLVKVIIEQSLLTDADDQAINEAVELFDEEV